MDLGYEKTVFFCIIDDITAGWVPNPRFTVLRVELKIVRCFYAFIWGNKGLNRLKSDEIGFQGP